MNTEPCELRPDIPTASELILDVLGMLEGIRISLPQATRAGQAFGYSDATMRAALSRLRSRGRIQSHGRGVYGLPEAPMLQWVFNRSWGQHIDQIVPWEGHWMMASWPDTVKLSRNDTLFKENLLLRYGFQRWRPRLFIRPDNIAGGVSAMQERLVDWPESQHVSLCEMRQVSADLEAQLFALWTDPACDLDVISQQLIDSQNRTGSEITAATAAEVLSIGRFAVKAILKDSRLPEPFGHTKNLKAISTSLATYERFGVEVWKEYLGI